MDRFAQEVVWSKRKLGRRLKYSRGEIIRTEEYLGYEAEKEKSNFRIF